MRMPSPLKVIEYCLCFLFVEILEEVKEACVVPCTVWIASHISGFAASNAILVHF